MNTVSNTISNIGGKKTEIVRKNRYCVVSKDDSQKIYCFTTPVFDKESGKLVQNVFVQGDKCYEVHGSDGLVKIHQDAIHFIRNSEIIEIHFSEKQEFSLLSNGKLLKSKEFLIYPTFNGILVKELIAGKQKSLLKVIDRSRRPSKCNSKYFALMKGKFEPTFTLNAMYAEDKHSSVFYNTTLSFKKQADTTYQLEINTTESANRVFYEMNLYEPKLIQDTTVESRRPKENNVYGSIAFLGKSPDFGTQFLYSRIDMHKILDIKDSIFESIKLYVPYYMVSGNHFHLFTPFKRFCSFGANWTNKIQSSDIHIKSSIQNGFLIFDLSPHLLTKTGHLKENEGIVVKPNINNESFSIVATADNYFTPQILEFKLKNKEK